jgi:hypothetical protein
MFFKLDNDSLLSHNQQLTIHKSLSCSDANHVIGHIEISVMGRNEISKHTEMLQLFVT